MDTCRRRALGARRQRAAGGQIRGPGSLADLSLDEARARLQLVVVGNNNSNNKLPTSPANGLPTPRQVRTRAAPRLKGIKHQEGPSFNMGIKVYGQFISPIWAADCFAGHQLIVFGAKSAGKRSGRSSCKLRNSSSSGPPRGHQFAELAALCRHLSPGARRSRGRVSIKIF